MIGKRWEPIGGALTDLGVLDWAGFTWASVSSIMEVDGVLFIEVHKVG